MRPHRPLLAVLLALPLAVAPGCSARRAAPAAAPVVEPAPAPAPDSAPAPHETWIWPMEGELSSNFGARELGQGWHGGLDIRAPEGTPVVAARSGRVSFSGRIGRYGLLVVIDHGEWTSSWYAHLSKTTVREGAIVVRGDPIGNAGRSGNATGSHLHFEIRQNDVPFDPCPALDPPCTGASANPP